MRKILVITLLATLSGCASTDYKGQGEYFELKYVNVVERDLSQSLITQIQKGKLNTVSLLNGKPNTAYSEKKSTSKQISKKKRPEHTFVILSGEQYQDALTRWLNDKGYKNVVWSINEYHQEMINSKAMRTMQFQGSFKNILDELSAQLGFPIRILVDSKMKVAGVYDFKGAARIIHVQGKTIKQVTQHIVDTFKLRWEDSDELSRSWLAASDYKFGADYYLLVGKNDIDTALTTVLEDYPVYARIVESTGQVIIQEEL